jgi:hypothetical protein
MWLIEGERSDYVIHNLLDRKQNLRINIDPDAAVYSKTKNKLYITGKDNNVNLFSILNIKSGKTELSFKLKSYAKYGRMFLSGNEDKLYFPYYDTASNSIKPADVKLAYLSALTNKIIPLKNLSDLGIPGADSYYLVNGKKGKGIIESFFDSEDSYYTLYDFDHDTASPAIFYHGNADSYFTNNGKYLILAEKMESSAKGDTNSVCSGSILIYNIQQQKMLESLSLSPGGYLFSFDNYPDNLYYMDNQTGKIITLNIDSIVKESGK